MLQQDKPRPVHRLYAVHVNIYYAGIAREPIMFNDFMAVTDQHAKHLAANMADNYLDELAVTENLPRHKYTFQVGMLESSPLAEELFKDMNMPEQNRVKLPPPTTPTQHNPPPAWKAFSCPIHGLCTHTIQLSNPQEQIKLA